MTSSAQARPQMATCTICNIEQPLTSMAETVDTGDDGMLGYCCIVCEAEQVRHKFDSATALVLYQWSMDSSYDDSMSQECEWMQMFGRYILSGNDQGFVYSEEFADVAKCQAAWDRYHDDGMGYSEFDASIAEDRGRWFVYFDGKPLHVWPNHVGEITERRCIAAVRLEAAKTGYYPNLWRFDERGSITRIDY